MLANLFYFKKISRIGGTEQFLYEIARKYKDYDITIYYDQADPAQLKRLKQYVRCQRRMPGETVKCKRAFFNFNIDMINDVDADRYYFVSHANWKELEYEPPIKNEKLEHCIGVSEFATRKIKEYAEELGKEITAERCYNPMQLEPKEKIIKLVAAGRFDDKVKGRDRLNILIEEMDRYCQETGRHYLFLIFTNPVNNTIIHSKNVAIMQPRVDVRPYIADADFTVTLSNDMETFGYTINESLGYGVTAITTPLTILEELPIPEGANLICDWNMENVKEIVKKIFEGKPKRFEYEPPKDSWEKFLVRSKSNYKPKPTKIIKAKKRFYDTQEGVYVESGQEIERDTDRAEEMIQKQFCKDV